MDNTEPLSKLLIELSNMQGEYYPLTDKLDEQNTKQIYISIYNILLERLNINSSEIDKRPHLLCQKKDLEFLLTIIQNHKISAYERKLKMSKWIAIRPSFKCMNTFLEEILINNDFIKAYKGLYWYLNYYAFFYKHHISFTGIKSLQELGTQRLFIEELLKHKLITNKTFEIELNSWNYAFQNFVNKFILK